MEYYRLIVALSAGELCLKIIEKPFSFFLVVSLIF